MKYYNVYLYLFYAQMLYLILSILITILFLQHLILIQFSTYGNTLVFNMYKYYMHQGIGTHGVVHWGYAPKWYTAPCSP